MRTRLACLILAMLMLTGCAQKGSTASTTEPALETIPETTERPAETAPKVTVPPETEPAETAAPETEPTKPIPSEPLPDMTAHHAFVYDCGREEYLYLLGGDEDPVYPASTTKVFTAWVALQYLQPNQVVTVGEEINCLEWEASTAGLQVGDTLTAANLVKCLLMPSGCDAAYALAAAAGREIAGDPAMPYQESLVYFMDEMNRVAAERDWTNTRFITPDGYHRDYHRVSQKAYVDIGKLCVSNETILEATSQFHGTAEFTDGRTLNMTNLNEILNPEGPYYRESCVGIKTGRTNAAGSCMLAAFREEDHYVLVGIFGSADMYDRYREAVLLYDTFVKEK